MPLPEIGLEPGLVESLDAPEVLATALRALGRDRLAIASSFGPEDIVLIDLLVVARAATAGLHARHGPAARRRPTT